MPDKRPRLALPKSGELVVSRVCRHPSEWQAGDRQFLPPIGNGGGKGGYVRSSRALSIFPLAIE